MTRPEIEPRSPGRLANTLTARPKLNFKRRTHPYSLSHIEMDFTMQNFITDEEKHVNFFSAFSSNTHTKTHAIDIYIYIYWSFLIIISKQLNMKIELFTLEELDSVLRKIENIKAAGLDEIPPEIWKTRQVDVIRLQYCNAVYNQNPIVRWMKGCILPFSKKGDLGLVKNYRGITLTSIAAKIYNALLHNRIKPKIDNILRKNQNGFRRNSSMSSQILTIRKMLEGVRAKNQQATILFVDFTKAFDSIHRGKMEQILLAYGLPKETVAAIMIHHRNTKVKVRSSDEDTGYFYIVARVLREDTRAP